MLSAVLMFLTSYKKGNAQMEPCFFQALQFSDTNGKILDPLLDTTFNVFSIAYSESGCNWRNRQSTKMFASVFGTNEFCFSNFFWKDAFGKTRYTFEKGRRFYSRSPDGAQDSWDAKYKILYTLNYQGPLGYGMLITRKTDSMFVHVRDFHLPKNQGLFSCDTILKLRLAFKPGIYEYDSLPQLLGENLNIVLVPEPDLSKTYFHGLPTCSFCKGKEYTGKCIWVDEKRGHFYKRTLVNGTGVGYEKYADSSLTRPISKILKDTMSNGMIFEQRWNWSDTILYYFVEYDKSKDELSWKFRHHKFNKNERYITGDGSYRKWLRAHHKNQPGLAPFWKYKRGLKKQEKREKETGVGIPF